ncbi:MAG: ring-hydroxylating oxygenase subunit alpha [Gammaproteobacteria bacterium]|nr:ring-hydroxylating oxygenase subunit alpha [Gammaproteobacteria bacterium]MDH3856605.1 ring-hydroxylating oxygenase subunit alpha [Gammaproteobacteria bacterium]
MSSAILSRDEFSQIKGRYDETALRSHSINTRCYVDPKFLQIEREQIFHRSWQFLCHEEKLREPGGYVTSSIEGQPIIALLNRNGELRAYYNVCKHRGHELLSGEGQTKRITCPYHAWTYDLDGTLVTAPRSEHLENFNQKEICLEPVRIEIFCHLVFVNLDTEATALSTQSGDLANEIMHYAPDLASLTFATRLSYRIKANWKAVVDNFLECYHCPVAHKGFSSMIDMDTYQVKTHGIYSSHMAKARLGENSAYNIADATVTDHAVWFLWPNMTLMRYPGRGNFMVWRFYPINEQETWEEFDFFFETAEPNETEKEALRFIDEVLQPEDIGLVESVQRGMNTPAFNSGRYMVDIEGSGASEHAVHHFHGLILEAYKRSSEVAA